ncbi:hypothetical protein CANARDRAFT_27001 [[Candida] arabinofermentans NRRL YB-2248]|uniref:GLC7-interacting protein 3 n=1 Tax=[Candida] arabinofermentans NRRL YB-2248 TaxID=983967 RepID=A0A1E4T7B0_9ASCO|nr:hypothetical protein CANARDRAFT_27001 [[Candida] arabinofermentans NRRL YB-2248]
MPMSTGKEGQSEAVEDQTTTSPQLQQQLEDPGVSNGDVDWLFRGKAVKKLSRKNTLVSHDVKHHLPSTTSSQSTIPEAPTPAASQPSQPIPILKPSLKISTNTTATQPSAFPNPESTPSTPASTLAKLIPSKVLHSTSPSSSTINSSSPVVPQPQKRETQTTLTTPLSAGAPERPRASSLQSLIPRARSLSDAKDKPVQQVTKKSSIFSSLSSKIRGQSTQQTVTPVPRSPSITSSTTQEPVGTTSTNKPLSRSSSRRESVGHSSNIPATTTATTTAAQVKTPLSASETQKKSSVTDESLSNKLAKVPFKRVAFALGNLPDDPQQQIPSRRPKKGNVVIPEDLLSPPARLSIGITDSFNHQTKDETPQVDQKLLQEAEERQRMCLLEAQKHSMEAHSSALRIAKEVSGYRKQKASRDLVDEVIADSWSGGSGKFSELSKNGLDIDTPIHEHVNYFDREDVPAIDEEYDSTSVPDSVQESLTKLSLDLLYTRCCHLREILPIPATLKQLKHKTRPLHVLKMLNPKPTLIDILSFSDFLAIAPIVTVIFDNVTIDSQMLNIVLVSLSTSTTLEKLSLRNVAIDEEGWLSLCKFLTLNKSISKLDISQQKIKSDTPKRFHRSEMDWDLFTHSLILKGGLEELVINGCKLTTSQFRHLVQKGLSLKTKRLGLASTNLNNQKAQYLADWISSPGNTCVGIDIAFNTLSEDQLEPFKEAFKNKMDNINLIFFSLNQTGIDVDLAKELVKYISTSKTLRFLDLGNNPQLFPGIIPTLTEYLPKFQELRRVHFEFDELTEAAIIQLCLTFVKCPKLIHVSLLGNNNINPRTAASLYSTVKQSNIYNLDIDYDAISEEISSKIAFYLMRNMEKFLTGNMPKTNEDDEDLIFDGSLLTRSAETLMDSTSIKSEEEKQIISNALVQKTIRLRKEIHKTMNKLFDARAKGTLTLEGKENLLRFCLLDDSLESIIHIFSEDASAADQVSGTGDVEQQLNLEIQQQEHQRILQGKQTLQQEQIEMQSQNDKLQPNKDLPLKRPELIKTLSSQLPMHQSSSDVIFTGPIVSPQQTITSYFSGTDGNNQNAIDEFTSPHQVVIDANSKPIDHLTGLPVLMRRISQTSVHARELEEEEGEFHRWGFFVQQQNSMMPNDQPNVNTMTTTQQLRAPPKEEQPQKVQALEQVKPAVTQKPTLKINNIPSGPQLRQAVIKAKGIESVSDLIGKINKDMSQIHSIYNQDPTSTVVSSTNTSPPNGATIDNKLAQTAPGTATPVKTATKKLSELNISNTNESQTGNHPERASKPSLGELVTEGVYSEDGETSPTSPISMNSEDGFVEGRSKLQADIVYEKLLDDVARVRSNRSQGENSQTNS